jgi:hypothetical protein
VGPVNYQEDPTCESRSCSSTDATPRTVYTRLLTGLETMVDMRFPAANPDSRRLVFGGFQLTRTCDLEPGLSLLGQVHRGSADGLHGGRGG